jgi:hypothetical protein
MQELLDGTRGEFLRRQQDEFYAAATAQPGQALAAWQRTLSEREALHMAEARTNPALFGQELFVRLPAGDAPHKLIDWVWLGGG